MSTAQRINDCVRRRQPDGVCDSCICDELGFNYVSQAALVTTALATTSDFKRAEGECVSCKRRRMVIRASPARAASS